MKLGLSVNLPVTIFKEGEAFVAYSPALDLSTCGKSENDVRRMWNEAVEAFFEELIEEGTLEKVLSDLGWRKINNNFQPPEVVDQSMIEMKLPIAV